MSSFDPDFTHFSSSRPYRNTRTDHEPKFESFRTFVVNGQASTKIPGQGGPFVIHCQSVSYFSSNEKGEFEESADLPPGFHRANSFKNYKSTDGHPKGLFYELNLYTSRGGSAHHTSRVQGAQFPRDDSTISVLDLPKNRIGR